MIFVLSLIIIMIVLFIVIKNDEFRMIDITLLIPVALLFLGSLIHNSDFMVNRRFNNSKSNISIVTKRWKGETISYYEINDQLEIRTIKKIKYEPNNALYLENCFDSYSIKYNKTNAYMEESCKVLDKDRNLVEYDDTIKDIINLISNLEHAILESKIIIVDNDYYVDVAFNVNLWTPYELYKYENSKLKIIYTFNDEEVIYIKETK